MLQVFSLWFYENLCLSSHSSFVLCFMNQHLGLEITDNLPGTWPLLHEPLAFLLFFFPLEMRNLSFSWWRGIQEIKEVSKTEKIRPLSLADPSAQGICTSAAACSFSLLFLLFSVKSSSFIQTTANTTEKTIVSKHMRITHSSFICSFIPSTLEITTLWSEDINLSEMLCKSSLN